MQLGDYRNNSRKVQRFFGRDITNLDRRIKKNNSIYDKIPIAYKNQPIKTRARSLYNRKQILPSLAPARDPIHQYKQQIIDHMVKLQKKQPQELTKNVSQKMRQILIDWLVDVHEHFELKPQTLQLTLCYLADFTSTVDVTKQQYQLVGVACLSLASKYQQIYPPRPKHFIQVTADTYTMQDLKNMQVKIIAGLNFQMQRTTPLQLLQAYSQQCQQLKDKSLSFCKYFIQVAMFQGISKKYTPSTIVAAAMQLCQRMPEMKTIHLKLESSIKPSRQEMIDCFKDILNAIKTPNKYQLNAIKKKYARSKYHNVSKIRISANQ